MSKKITLFQEMFMVLRENVIPSIMSSLQEMGMLYSHIHINPQQSLCFFNHLSLEFPFQNLQTIKDDKGNNIQILIFNIRSDGQISICENLNFGLAGTVELINEVVLFEDFNKMFDGVVYENAFLFYLSRELTNKAYQSQEEVKVIKTLLGEMYKITPIITREVLFEKKIKIVKKSKTKK